MSQRFHAGLVAIATVINCVFVFTTNTACTALIAADDFESYTDGSSILSGTGGSGWTQPWIGNTVNATSFAKASWARLPVTASLWSSGATGENRGIAVRQFAGQTGDVYIWHEDANDKRLGR